MVTYFNVDFPFFTEKIGVSIEKKIKFGPEMTWKMDPKVKMKVVVCRLEPQHFYWKHIYENERRVSIEKKSKLTLG